jgi:hypothetical protein
LPFRTGESDLAGALCGEADCSIAVQKRDTLPDTAVVSSWNYHHGGVRRSYSGALFGRQGKPMKREWASNTSQIRRIPSR